MAAKDDLRFVYEQARRFVGARPWERLAHASLYLDLKVGSWQDVCAQHFSNGSTDALFLFPGRRNLRDLQHAGMAEPPAGTIFVELLDDRASPESIAAVGEYGWPADLRPIPGFQVITPDGWLPLERNQTRLLALAFAAITDFDEAGAGVDAEIAGELTMPGAVRGRYRARRGPAEEDGIVPLMGVPRPDLFGDADCMLSFTTTGWSEYWALRERAPLCRPAKLPFEERGELIPLVTISAPPDQAAEIAQKLTAAEPLGIAFGEPDGALTVVLAGLKESYVLLQAQEQREELMLWRHATRSSGGAYAVVVEDNEAGQQPGDRKAESVHAIFECRSGGD